MSDSEKTREQLTEELGRLRTTIETLNESQNRYQAIFESVTEGILVGITQERRYIYVNPAICKMFGYTAEEMVRLTVKDMHPHQHLPYVLQRFEAFMRNEAHYTPNMPCLHKNGTVFYANISAAHVVINNKACFVGLFTDSTERKKTEDALRESEARYKAIFESAKEGIIVGSAESRQFIYANPAICKMFGYTAEEMTRLAVKDIHPGEYLEYVSQRFEAFSRDEILLTRNVPCLRKNGTVFYADISATHIVINNKPCFAGFFTDTTEQKLAEDALKESEQRFKSVVENIGLGVTVISPQMEVISINDHLKQRISGIDISTRPICYKVFNNPPRDTFCPNCPVCLTLADGLIHESINVTPAGYDDQVNLRIISSPIKDAQGRITAVIELVENITERTKAETALRESEQKFRVLVERLPAVTYTAALDEVSTTTYVSPQIQQILGVMPDNYKADPELWLKMVHPDDLPSVMQALKMTRKAGRPFSCEYRMIARDGRIVWVRDEAEIVRDTQGKPLYIQGLMYDITSTKHIETALKESEEKFRGLAERSFDMIFTNDAGGIVTYVSPACERIFGCKSEEMIGKHFTSFLKKTEIPVAARRFADKLQGKPHGTLTLEALKKDGSSVFIELISSLVIKDGAPVGMQGIIRDVTERVKSHEELQKAHNELESRVQQRTAELALVVETLQKEITERKRAEELLRSAEERFRTIFENAVVGIYRTTPDGRILMANPAILKLLGYGSLEEISRLNLEKEGIDPLTPRSEFKRRMQEHGSVTGLESIWLRRDGSRLYVLENAYAVRDDRGNIIYYEGTAQDITKRKEAEQKLILYQEQLRSLASELSLAEERLRRKIATDLHDNVSQNLAISKMKLEALAQSVNQDHAESLKEVTDLIGRTIESSRSLTFEMSPPVLYELGFIPALGWLANQTRHRFTLEAEFIDDGKPKPIAPDVSVVLFQAVRELVNNVVKHAKAHKLKITASRLDGNICITVEDDGVGFDMKHAISAKKHPSRKAADYSPRGFGLFNIRERLNHIGGTIELHSKSGHGTSVTLTAPLLKTPKKSTKKKGKAK